MKAKELMKYLSKIPDDSEILLDYWIDGEDFQLSSFKEKGKYKIWIWRTDEKKKEVIKMIHEDHKKYQELEWWNIEKENRIFQLERKLKNAEDNYLKLLWEYTEYKNQVRDAYRKFEDEERNYNNALWELDKVIMNR